MCILHIHYSINHTTMVERQPGAVVDEDRRDGASASKVATFYRFSQFCEMGISL